jgi:geranylgeranyl pyrophosphate synthase
LKSRQDTKRIIAFNSAESALLKTEPLSWLSEYIDAIDKQLSELFNNPATNLEKAASEALSNGGKRVRAVLALLMCELFSGDYGPAVPIAVAYELAHASALIQDDIIDSSNMRRGGSSIVSKYGLSNAILTSDFLLFNVPKIMASYGDTLESSKLAKLFDLLGEACRGATWGEFLDLDLSRESRVSELEYENMIKSKTASLIAAPAASGAIIGGASEGDCAIAYKFGELLGMAYQVHDDALDLFGDERAIGKPIFTDLRSGKKNLILIHCLNHCTDEEERFLNTLVGRIGGYDKEEIIRSRFILQKYGSLNYSKSRSVKFVDEAKELFTKFPSYSETRNSLLALTDYLSERYY